jgi:hypothetical protein
MTDRDRILKRAFELAAEEEAEHEQAEAHAELRVAVEDMGVDPAHVDRARAELLQKEQERRRQRRKLALLGTALVTTGLVAAGAFHLLFPGAPEPWISSFDEPKQWALDVNAGTEAAVEFDEEAGRGRVARLTVRGFAVEKDGSFRVNLDSQHVPENAGRYRTLTIDAKGTLPVARVYLEHGVNERWRSPALRITPSWTQHRLDLQRFEHQRRESGIWRTVDDDAPEDVTQLSIKLGTYMNSPDAQGDVAFDALRFE